MKNAFKITQNKTTKSIHHKLHCLNISKKRKNKNSKSDRVNLQLRESTNCLNCKKNHALKSKPVKKLTR